MADETRQRGDMATGGWDKERPLPYCRGCGQTIPTMFAIPAHIDCAPFEIVYPAELEQKSGTE